MQDLVGVLAVGKTNRHKTWFVYFLLQFIEVYIYLFGAVHIKGCGEGGCGACTVTITEPNKSPQAVNACLMPLCRAAGCRITTVEGN